MQAQGADDTRQILTQGRSDVVARQMRMHYTKSIPFTTFRRFARMPCSRYPPHTSKHMKQNLLLFTGLKQQELSAEWTTTKATVFLCKNSPDPSPNKTPNMADFSTPYKNTWESFAAGILYTHMYVCTDMYVHAFVSIMSSEPYSDSRSNKSALAQMSDRKLLFRA